jgi:hypothetical protein
MTHALASGHTVPTFNGLFYATVATIIPVLFLAVAVQGAAYEDLLKATAGRAMRYRPRRETLNSHIDTQFVRVLGLAQLLVPYIILIYGVAGEYDALISLYYKRTVQPANSALVAAMLLTGLAAARPAVSLVMHAYRLVRIVFADAAGKPIAKWEQQYAPPEHAEPTSQALDREPASPQAPDPGETVAGAGGLLSDTGDG